MGWINHLALQTPGKEFNQTKKPIMPGFDMIGGEAAIGKGGDKEYAIALGTTCKNYQFGPKTWLVSRHFSFSCSLTCC